MEANCKGAEIKTKGIAGKTGQDAARLGPFSHGKADMVRHVGQGANRRGVAGVARSG
jgi:hypothetical protein